jgi:hypothetical protein
VGGGTGGGVGGGATAPGVGAGFVGGGGAVGFNKLPSASLAVHPHASAVASCTCGHCPAVKAPRNAVVKRNPHLA